MPALRLVRITADAIGPHKLVLTARAPRGYAGKSADAHSQEEVCGEVAQIELHPALSAGWLMGRMWERLKRVFGKFMHTVGLSIAFDSCTIRHAGVAQAVEPLPSKQRTRVQLSPPAPPLPRSSKWPRTPVLQIGKRGFKSRTWHHGMAPSPSW